MQFCEFISFLCTVIHTMSVFMCGVCLQGVWCGNRDRGGPCVLHSPGGRVVRDGPGWWSLWEVCRDVPLNNGKNRQVGHITFIHIPPSFSHLSSWPAYSLAIFYFSTLLFLFSILLSIHNHTPAFHMMSVSCSPFSKTSY